MDVTREHSSRFSAEVLRSLANNYGTEIVDIIALANERPELGTTLGSSTTIAAQVVRAVKEEMALTLEDVVFRRTELASGGSPGAEALRRCAECMASELGWDVHRTAAELRGVSKSLSRYTA
jgi:glycerol-3-phosphate dehydrogenase